MLNPMAGIVTSLRRILLQNEPPIVSDLVISTIVSVGLCVLGYVYFKRAEPEFADVL
jgi:ABC-type polysaccharide/polyol phosphate export permease